MAGPSIAVRVIGDLSGFGKSMTDTAAHGESAASRIRGAFSGAIGAFNQTGILGPFEGALNGIDQAIGAVVEHGKNIGPALMGAGTALAGIGAGLATVGSKDQAAHQQLQQAVEATGKSYDDYADQVDKAVKHQEKFGDTASTTQDALRILTQATGDPAKALQLLGETTDLAAAKHISLDDAATKLGKTFNGNTKLLKEYGISVDNAKQAGQALASAEKANETAATAHATAVQKLNDLHALYAGKTHLTTQEQIALRDAQAKVDATGKTLTDTQKKLTDAQAGQAAAAGKGGDAVALLADKIKGQGNAAADTFTGKLNGIKAAVEDNVAEFGQKYGPAITAAGTAIAGLGAAMTTGKAIMDTLKNSTILQTTATKVAEAAQWAWNAAMDANPIMLVVLAVAALIAAVVLAYQHVGWFRAAVDDFANAAVAAFNWVWSAVQTVFGWIIDNWPLLLAILIGPVAIAADLIYHNFDRIKGYAQDAIGFVQSVFDGFVGFVSGLPGRVAGFFSGMFDGLKDAAKAAFNFVADAWNNTAGQLSFSIPGWVPSIGGDSFGVPKIPHWYASGGIFTQPTVIGVGEAGPEAVVPLNRAGALGPVVNIENVHVAREIDVDVFMRRVAWQAQTAVV